MTKPRKIATFSFDRRGWAALYKHIEKQIQTKYLDKDLLELNLIGSKVKCFTDMSYLYKIMNLFASIRTLLLKNMCLESLKLIGQALCTKLMTCKIVDISENTCSKEEVVKFIDAMEGRAFTKEVPPIWVVTDFEDTFTKNFACCSPYKFRGCKCDVKRFVHVGNDSDVFMYPKAIPKKSPKIPPPPDYAPPPPPIMAYISAFAQAKQQFELALSMERDKMHTIVIKNDEFVFVEMNGTFEFTDFNRVEKGLVPNTMGEMLKLTDLKLVQGEGIISATTLEYYVDQDCATPDSYHWSVGGETIWIRADSYSDGWVAASFETSEWKWFPLSMCLP